MKVLLITQLPPPNGGIASWSNAFLSEFHRDGDNRFTKDNTQIIVVNNAIIGKRAEQIHGKKSLWDEIKRSISLIKSIRTIFKKNPIDVVHINITCAKLGMLRDLLTLSFVPHSTAVFAHCHCSVPDRLGKSSLNKWCFKRIISKCAFIMVLNKASKDCVNRLMLQCNEKLCTIVPNPIESRFIINEKRNFDGKIKRIIFTGRFESQKGSDEFIEAAKHFPEIRFVVAGSVDDSIPLSSLPNNIIALGNIDRDRVFKELDQADVFFFPSHSEGFSMSLLEAMARGLPVVASDVGANREMIGEDGGFIFQLNNPQDAMRCIERMNDPVCRRKCSEANRQKVMKEYTTSAVVQTITNLYCCSRRQNDSRG